MSKLLFSFKFFYRNLRRNILRTILLFISFFLLITTINLIFSTKKMTDFYAKESVLNKTAPFSFKISMGSSSNTRFFNSSELDETNLNYAKFFKIQLLNKKDLNYLTVYFGDNNSISKALLHDVVLNNNEIIVSSRYAKNNNLKKGDKVVLSIGEGDSSFIIKEVIKDYGILNSNSVFVNYENISDVLKVLFNINVTIHNLHNEVYFISNEVEKDIEYLKTVSDFKNLKYTVLVNEPLVKQFSLRLFKIYLLGFIVLFVILILITYTTFLMLFKEKMKDYNVIISVGGTKTYFTFIWLIEGLFYLLPNAIFSYFFSSFFINTSLRRLGIIKHFKYAIRNSLFSFLIMIVLFLFILVVFNFRIKKKAERKGNLYLYICFFIISFISYILIYYSNLSYKVIYLFVIIVVNLYPSVYLIFNVFSFFLRDGKFKYYFKIKINSKFIYRYAFMILNSIIAIFLLIGLKGYIEFKYEKIEHNIKSDLIISNIKDDLEDFKNVLLENENINEVVLVAQFESKNLTSDIDLNQMYSIKGDDFLKVFNLEIDESLLYKLNNNQITYVFLPHIYEKVYHYKIDDEVEFLVEGIKEKMIIGGFVDDGLNVTGYTNIHLTNEDFTANNLFITSSNKEELKLDLVNKYGSSLIYIVTVDSLKSQHMENFQSINLLLSIFLIFFVVVLLFSLFNQTTIYFESVKENYQKLYIIGIGKKELKVLSLKEGIIIFMVILLLSIGVVLLFRPLLSEVLILLNEYENLDYQYIDLLKGLLLSLGVLITTKLFYNYNLENLNMLATTRE